MTWTEKFKRKHRGFGIENLMLYILIPTALVYIMQYLLNMPIIQLISFSRADILSGQVWRIFTFLFVPDTDKILWFIIGFMFDLFVGRSLENTWGKELFTLYYIIGAVMAVLQGFITGYATNSYLNLSLFLAFAIIFPDVKLLLYGILPVKAKYLGIVYAAFIGIDLVGALFTLDFRFMGSLVVSLLNLILFFGHDFYNDLKRKRENKRRKREFEESLRK